MPFKLSTPNPSHNANGRIYTDENEAIEDAKASFFAGASAEFVTWNDDDGDTVIGMASDEGIDGALNATVQRMKPGHGFKFYPTHKISLFVPGNDDADETIEVTLDADDDGAGPAYTREEWESATSADWERDASGSWTFQGQATPPGREVSVSRI